MQLLTVAAKWGNKSWNGEFLCYNSRFRYKSHLLIWRYNISGYEPRIFDVENGIISEENIFSKYIKKKPHFEIQIVLSEFFDTFLLLFPILVIFLSIKTHPNSMIAIFEKFNVFIAVGKSKNEISRRSTHDIGWDKVCDTSMTFKLWTGIIATQKLAFWILVRPFTDSIRRMT